ncbi:beta-ketoacyl synthase [Nocardia miyunensis]|uniref:beta-ketoacyl synthase n=1 Tax=Nocardia miyunensis TaxID=282684 RepID=UPI000AEF0278|nr:beta-ketoacyl synthase [Nocardia miyunensis]
MTILEFDGIAFDPTGAPRPGSGVAETSGLGPAGMSDRTLAPPADPMAAEVRATATTSPVAGQSAALYSVAAPAPEGERVTAATYPVPGPPSASHPAAAPATEVEEATAATYPAAMQSRAPHFAVTAVEKSATATYSAGVRPTAPNSSAPASSGEKDSSATYSDGADVLAEIRAGVVAAHRAALGAQVAVQRALWERAREGGAYSAAAVEPFTRSGRTTLDRVASDAQRTLRQPAGAAGTGIAGPAAATLATVATNPAAATAIAAEDAFKPLARSGRTTLDRAALEQLTRGEVTDVFGPAYRRAGVVSAVRVGAAQPLVLTRVEALELRGGDGKGRVAAEFEGDVRAAAIQAAEVFAIFAGIHLCLSGSTLTAAVDGVDGGGAGRIELVVGDIDLIPRPHVAAVAHTAAGVLAVTVTVVEAAGAGVGPGAAESGSLLNEFHMVHLSRGDQAIAMGPEFARYTGVRATRLPTGGLLLVDRVLTFDGARGVLDGASYTSEYDSPGDSWYYGDTANESMPHFVYMETSLQAALLMGYYAGPTLTEPGTTLSLRNLGGSARVLRRIDLRDSTIQQSSRLLSTTLLPGSSLQTFDYTLSVEGEPFYTGETMFGYFSDQALANQTGLDAGRSVPSWRAEHPREPARVIDVAARRADPAAPLCARRTLALIDRIEVVDGGGEHEAGYLHSLREIDSTDWYFDRHFHLDPVIPGSLGVESVIHAVQEWMLDAGFADGMTDPVFRIPCDIEFSWRYRGQFLPSDGTVELEAHIKQVRRDAHTVTVVVDGSLWKPGLRIYELIDLAIELADRAVLP